MPEEFIGFQGLMRIERDGEYLSVLGFTPEGIRVATDLVLMIDAGKTVEEICERYSWNKEQFRIFYVVCNQSGMLDIIDRAKEEVSG